MTADTEFIVPTFLPDHASNIDFFGSHQRVASAISATIRASSTTKVIGVLGPWGSGKSTIIRLVEQEFETHPQEGRIHYFFSYDAWLHQNDPPRRSFLESLVRFLVSKKLTTEPEWKDDIERLSRRIEENDISTTPTLTFPGKLVASSLLLFAYGWKLADRTNSLTIGNIQLPLSTIGYLMISAPVWAAAGAWLYQKCFNREHCDSVFSLFVNKATERVKTKTIRTPDPTAIEFQSAFQRVIASIARPDRALVFVIDNLDRIPESDALAIWSTIRSFFVDELKPATEETNKLRGPTVLLPLDPKAVERMYGKQSADAAELARSFMDKTFDLAFQVSPPVQSGWQNYLAKRLNETFGQLPDEDIIQFTKLYELWIIQTRHGVTPRDINKLVNEAALLRLQWGNAIPLCTLAYHAINREALDKNFDNAINQPDTYIARFDKDWAQHLSAVHYGVPPEQVMQVLLLPKITAALTMAERDSFFNLSKAIGFEPLLLRAIEDQLSTEVTSEYIAVVAGLIEAADLTRTARIIQIENLLREAVPQALGWQRITSLSANGVTKLLSDCPPDQLASFAQNVRDWLGNINDQKFSFDPTNAEGWNRCATALLKTAQEREIIQVPGGAFFFLQVLDLNSTDSENVGYLRPSVGPDEIVSQIAQEATTLSFVGRPDSRLEKLALIDLKWEWSPCIDAAIAYLENSARAEPGISAAIDILGGLRKIASSKTLNARIKDLAAGTLFDILSMLHVERQYEAEGRILALLILFNPSFNVTNGVGNAEIGRQLTTSLSTALQDRPSAYNALDGALSRFGYLKDLINASELNADLATVIKTLFERRVVEDHIGPLHIDDVISRLPTYLSCLTDDARLKFMERLPTYHSFWDSMISGELTANKCTLLTQYIKGSSHAEISRKLVIDVSEDFDSEKWKPLLTSDAEPLPTILIALRSGPQEVRLGEPLLQALEETFESALINGNVTITSLERWFALAKALDNNRYRLLLKNIRDRILSGVSGVGTLNVLVAGKAELLELGDFASRSDDATRHVIFPLLDRLDQTSTWLIEHGSDVKTWIERSDGSTQGYLSERMIELVKREPIHAVAVASALGLQAPLSNKNMQNDQGATA